MKFDPDIHHRRSIRLRGYDYAVDGAYFVTICTHQRDCLFGEIAEGDVRLNPAGEAVREVWEGVPGRFPDVVLDQFVVMPNHVHGIIVINDVGALLAAPGNGTNIGIKGVVGALLAAPKIADVVNQGAASSAPTLGVIMRAFKSISAIAVNRLLDRPGQPLWQRNYYERILRGGDELDRARQYIMDNPLQWEMDKENPANVP